MCRLLIEVQEMEQTLPRTCRVSFDDPNILHIFQLIILPDEGYWHGGKYRFLVTVPEEYNIAVSYSICVVLHCWQR